MGQAYGVSGIGSMRSVPLRGSVWVICWTALRRRLSGRSGSNTHPLPRGGTDLMFRVEQIKLAYRPRYFALQVLVLVILGLAPGHDLHAEYGNRGDQDDVNVAPFVKEEREHEPNHRQYGAKHPHICLTYSGAAGAIGKVQRCDYSAGDEDTDWG